MKKIIIHYLLLGFILNFIWEISQSGLYDPHFKDAIDFLFVHLRAALGDVVILLVIYLIVNWAYKNKSWNIENKKGTYAFMAFLGFVIAIAIEKYAFLTDRWAYNNFMPMIPYIDVGLIPVLQMTLIAPLSLYLVKRYIIKLK